MSVNFNNQAGLLSSMTPEQLHRNSVQSGLANMSWDEFSGSVISCCGDRDAYNGPHPSRPYKGLGANNIGGNDSNPGVQYVHTTGTILVLNFAEVIQLTEELYAPGSLGSFNLQLQVTVENNQN
ncbi:MAG: major capsid protein V20 domain-containing protein [Candidatus Fonsibacter sp.]